MLNGARAGVAVASVAALATAPGAMAAALGDELVTPAVSGDLLHALGGRIGLEVASVIGSSGQALAMAYVDAAVRPMWTQQGIEWQTRCAAQCIETQSSPSTVIAVAHVSNPATGRSARVEIDRDHRMAPGSAQKNAVLTASADNLYRIRTTPGDRNAVLVALANSTRKMNTTSTRTFRSRWRILDAGAGTKLDTGRNQTGRQGRLLAPCRRVARRASARVDADRRSTPPPARGRAFMAPDRSRKIEQ
ncbi:hypothetical protein [Casimicrobium huifangae]|uniref:hypothetical protein n=1 Tax=Casimicrobium huifangae TaxID=2591109 RepID=UPI00378458A5